LGAFKKLASAIKMKKQTSASYMDIEIESQT